LLWRCPESNTSLFRTPSPRSNREEDRHLVVEHKLCVFVLSFDLLDLQILEPTRERLRSLASRPEV
jgi:hypothetical protein